jgi:hypothetical protein
MKQTFAQWQQKLKTYGYDYVLEENMPFASLEDWHKAYRYFSQWKSKRSKCRSRALVAA